MKLTVLGGGGVRSPFLAKSIVAGAASIGLEKVVFMDNNEKKLRTFGAMARQVAALLNPKIEFSLTTDPVDAITDADFVITTLRVGEDAARVADERIALNCGVLGQETTGAGGFAMAMRSIPALKTYCELVRQHARKGALIFNFTNPSGLVTQALRSEGFDNVYGICDAPSGFKSQLEKLYRVGPDDLSFTCFGLNHLSWFRDVKVRGRNVTDELVRDPRLYTETEMNVFDENLVRLSGNLLLNEYLYFYYFREKAVESILAAGKTRGETILEINREMMRELEGIDIERETERAFDIFIHHHFQRENSYMAIESKKERHVRTAPTLNQFIGTPDGGGYAGVALNFVKARHTGREIEMVLSVPNQGAIEGLNPEDVVEISCRIDRRGATPVHIGRVPEMQMNLIRTVKFFEKTAAQAIADRSIDKAVIALTAHPLVNSYSVATRLVQDYLAAHRPYIGSWS
jgi:6-phospho-beta-glucosidase